MSIINEPQLGAPQTEVGAQILQQGTTQMQQQFNGMPGMVGMATMDQTNVGQNMTMPNMQQNTGVNPGMVSTNTNPSTNVTDNANNSQLGVGQVGNINTIQNPNVVQNMQPQSQQVNEFPTIPDNNPVAQFPENAGQVGILTEAEKSQTNTDPSNGMNPGMGMPNMQQGMNPNMGMPNMQQNNGMNPSMGIPNMQQGMNPNMGMPNMQQGMQQNNGMNPNMGMPNMQQGMQQNNGMNPNMGMPNMQQGMQQNNGMNPSMGIPNMQQGMQQNNGMNPNMGVPNMQQHIPGSSAPGFNNGSYLQNQGGMFGPTPTGHPEKQKFQLQFTLIYAKARPTQKGTMITTGLIANPADRNAPAINFICFSGSATKQIQILEDASRSNYTTIEKAGGQPIWVEASWQWNDKNKNQPPAWQLMCDNFIFVNDQNLRQVAETWTPPVPPSPMDMLNGGQMQMGMGMPNMQQNNGMNPGMGMPNIQQGMGMPNMQQGMNPNMGMPNMQQGMNPNMGMPNMQQGMNPNMGMPNMS